MLGELKVPGTEIAGSHRGKRLSSPEYSEKAKGIHTIRLAMCKNRGKTGAAGKKAEFGFRESEFRITARGSAGKCRDWKAKRKGKSHVASRERSNRMRGLPEKVIKKNKPRTDSARVERKEEKKTCCRPRPGPEKEGERERFLKSMPGLEGEVNATIQNAEEKRGAYCSRIMESKNRGVEKKKAIALER